MSDIRDKAMATRPRCAVCDKPIPFRREGWFCSFACDDVDMAHRVGLVRLCYAIRDAARAALKATAPC